MSGRPMRRVGAMHIIDTLVAAGAERVAVNIVNHLPREKYVPYLCTTRADGPLDAFVGADVARLRLRRTSRFDLDAVMKLRHFIESNDIRIVHAHSSALFIARMAAMGTDANIIWHAHYGRYALEDQRAYHYRAATCGIGGVLTVNKEMAQWCTRRLGVPAKSVWYLPNPVSLEEVGSSAAPTLPGAKGMRIICLANFRAEKDHFTLLRAMSRVIRNVPEAHLLLAGKTNDQGYKDRVEMEISALELERNVSILGERHDVSAILQACDIGVLSSISEGLPMSLLEYGAAGLPAIATEVGECSDVLDYGRAGILVPHSSVEGLATAMTGLLRSGDLRRKFAEAFRERVRKVFSSKTVVSQVCEIYEMILGRQKCGRQYSQGERNVAASQTLS